MKTLENTFTPNTDFAIDDFLGSFAAHSQSEVEQEKITWPEFVSAMNVFAGDLNIVHHPDTPTISPFDEPHAHNEYSLTTLSGMSEADFVKRLRSKRVVLINQCMDRRGAYLAYQHLAKDVTDRLGENVQIILLSIGGGPVQVNELLTPEGEKSWVGRGNALKIILRFIAQEADVVEAHAIGHDCECGACKLFNGGVGIPDALGVQKGSHPERQTMIQLIKKSVDNWYPPELRPVTYPQLAHFKEIDADGEPFMGFKRFIKVENAFLGV